MPHSFLASSSHHQRPARSGSPGRTARVHGARLRGADGLEHADGNAGFQQTQLLQLLRLLRQCPPLPGGASRLRPRLVRPRALEQSE